MKTLSLVFTTMAAALLFYSCAESIDQSVQSSTESSSSCHNLLTKALNEKLSDGVSRQDVEDYLVYRMNETLDTVKDITRYEIDEVSYIYVVNTKDGRWFIFSGDYSSKPLLVEGEGSMYFEGNLSKHMQNLLKAIGSKIIENRTAYSTETSNNLRIWEATKRRSERERRMLRDNEIDTGDVVVEYIVDTLINSVHPKLTSTSWDPSYPFNEALPMYGDSLRCTAGCAVVAIAQLLYYTHFAFGYPNDTYDDASCDKFYNAPDYAYSYGNPSTTCWNGTGRT